jgi:hypothetical protein
VKSSEVERRLRGLSWPAPSDHLRARVLAEATVRPHIVTWSDRVWFSRTWRWSMAGATILLLSAQVWPSSRRAGRHLESTVVVAQIQMIEETARHAGLPDELAASLARRTVTGRTPIVERQALADQLFDHEERR